MSNFNITGKTILAAAAAARETNPGEAPTATFRQGDRVVHKTSGEQATIVRITGATTALIRFDKDAEYAAKHAIPASKTDYEFDLADWKCVPGRHKFDGNVCNRCGTNFYEGRA